MFLSSYTYWKINIYFIYLFPSSIWYSNVNVTSVFIVMQNVMQCLTLKGHHTPHLGQSATLSAILT